MGALHFVKHVDATGPFKKGFFIYNQPVSFYTIPFRIANNIGYMLALMMFKLRKSYVTLIFSDLLYDILI
jgi:hypothetical protein